jgi:hypothetical protein
MKISRSERRRRDEIRVQKKIKRERSSENNEIRRNRMR